MNQLHSAHEENPMPIRFKSLRSLTFLILTFVCAATSPTFGQTNDVEHLSGTWKVQVSLQNCITHAPLGPPFLSILAFTGNGTMSGTTQNPAFAPGQRTSDYGVWKRTGRSTFTAASEAYILFPAGPFVRGTQRIAQNISVQNNAFVSVATVQFFDVTGTTVISGCAVATATRFK
jgi:hypothetical protein